MSETKIEQTRSSIFNFASLHSKQQSVLLFKQIGAETVRRYEIIAMKVLVNLR